MVSCESDCIKNQINLSAFTVGLYYGKKWALDNNPVEFIRPNATHLLELET